MEERRQLHSVLKHTEQLSDVVPSDPRIVTESDRFNVNKVQICLCIKKKKHTIWQNSRDVQITSEMLFKMSKTFQVTAGIQAAADRKDLW